MTSVGRIVRGAVPLVVVFALSGCGYSLAGRGNFLPDYIRRIGVPQFVNHSTVPDIDRRITEEVRLEFASHSRYQVMPDVAGVDAILTGTIIGVRSDPTNFTASRQASTYGITVLASVEFRDTHSNKVLWSNPAVQFSDSYPVTSSTIANDPAAFFSGNTNALDRLAKSFARSVVTSILEAF